MNSTNLSMFCYYRMNDVFCWGGYLHQQKTNEPVLVEGQKVACPVCNGLGRVPTDFGKEILDFIEAFARPLMQKIVEETLQERK